jgi:hypothetical protein
LEQEQERELEQEQERERERELELEQEQEQELELELELEQEQERERERELELEQEQEQERERELELEQLTTSPLPPALAAPSPGAGEFWRSSMNATDTATIRTRMPHELKTHPDEFQAVLNGRMPWQLRRNDRDYRVGDQLLLKEWDPAGGEPRSDQTLMIGGYTSRNLLVRVDYIMDDAHRFGLDPDYVIMNISLVN